MDRLGRYILIALGISIAIFILWYFSNIVMYILVSLVVSLIGKPIVDWLSTKKIQNRSTPKWLSAAVTICVLIGIMVSLFELIVPIVYDKLHSLSNLGNGDIISYISVPLDRFNALLANNDMTAGLIEHSASMYKELLTKFTSVFDLTLRGVSSALDFIVTLFVAVFSVSFISFFFLKDSNLFKRMVISLFPKKYDTGIDKAVDKSISLLSKYFIGLMVESFIKILVLALGLYLIGIDLPTAIISAIIAGVLNVIPYIGPIIGGAIGVVLCITSGNIAGEDLNLVLWQMILLFSIFQLIDNIILQPYIYSSSVKAHPLEIFIVILMAGSMAGVLGMLLAIPAYTVLRVFAKVFFKDFSLVQKLTEKL